MGYVNMTLTNMKFMSCIIYCLYINQGKAKYVIVERKNSSKQKKIGQLTIENCTFGRVENFKYLGVVL